jgi:hypothetical protein
LTDLVDKEIGDPSQELHKRLKGKSLRSFWRFKLRNWPCLAWNMLVIG